MIGVAIIGAGIGAEHLKGTGHFQSLRRQGDLRS